MGITARADVLQTLDFSSTSPVYTEVGTPLNHASSIFTLQNVTDADMLFSLDGSTDQFYLVAMSAFVMDLTTNRASTDAGLYIPRGTQVWVKQATGAAATSGSVNVMSIYDSSN
jgi:hypothetical protein